MLNCRIETGVNPIRIICDTNLNIGLDCNIVNTAKDIRTIIAYCNNENTEKVEILKSKNVELIKVPDRNGVDLKALMEILGKMKIDSVLIEGGGSINASSIEAGIVNKIYAYIAPKVIGGKEALSPITGKGIKYMQNAIKLKNIKLEKIGNDILVTGYII